MPSLYKNIPGWFDFDDVYSEIVDKLPDNSTIVEVGCWMGRSTCYLAEKIAESNKNITVLAVDNWLGSNEPEHKRIIEEKGSIYRIWLKNLAPFKLVYPIIGHSCVVGRYMDNSSVDFVYIDASHEYEDVLADIETWLPKVKPGGFIGGHDYNENDRNCSGVVRAVKQTFSNYRIMRNSWLYEVLK